MPLPSEFLEALGAVVGAAHVRTDPAARESYGADALKRGHPADAVVTPDGADQISAILKLCSAHRVPIVPRGGGTGYTGGSVPVQGGVVLSLERMNRILEIDEENLVAIVEPNVITGTIQDAVERVGLFYPPDPASLRTSVIGGNVAECAGGPRAFKYGTTKQYVLGLQAVLPNGDIIETGGKVVKNVVGYDLTHLLVGSEGTLAVITRIILRLVPRPPVQSTLRATFATIRDATQAVSNVIKARVVPAAVELIDGDSLEAVAAYLNVRSLAPEGTGALLLLEVDGLAEAVTEEAARCEQACRDAGATEILRARDEADRQEIWRVRRELSLALKTITPIKFNHDVVVPKGRIPQLFEFVEQLKRDFRLRIPCFGHAGDGNIHVNIMVTPGDEDEMRRAHEAERRLFEGVVALEGSISGEHGIGFVKAKYLGLELDAQTIEIMKAVKRAFDPLGILNPGKIFPSALSAFGFFGDARPEGRANWWPENRRVDPEKGVLLGRRGEARFDGVTTNIRDVSPRALVLADNPIVIPLRPQFDAVGALDVVCGQLFQHFHELGEVCLTCASLNEEMQVIGHVAANKNLEFAQVRGALHLSIARFDDLTLKKVSLPAFRQDRDEIDPRAGVAASW